MDRLKSLIVFGQIVESGSFTAAGRRLNLSTTMVANYVKALETQLGARLFNRTTRQVTLTAAGELYHLRSARIIADLDEADRLAGSTIAAPQTPMRIYANSAIAPLLARAVAEFLQVKSTARVQLDFSPQTSELANGGYDLGIETSPKNSPFSSKKLMEWRHRPVASREYLKSHGTPQVPVDLQNHSCLHDGNYPYGTSWRFETARRQQQEVAVSPSFVSNDVEVLRHLATGGHGILLTPSFLVEADLRTGTLVAVVPQYRGVKFSIDAVLPEVGRTPARVTELLDFLVQYFARIQQ